MRQDGSFADFNEKGSFVAVELPMASGRTSTTPYASYRTFEITTTVPSVRSDECEIRIYGHKKGGSSNHFQMTIDSLGLVGTPENTVIEKEIVFRSENTNVVSTAEIKRSLVLFHDAVNQPDLSDN